MITQLSVQTLHPMDDASATDTCPGDIQIDEVMTTIPGTGVDATRSLVTFTATDGCGNTTSATQTITIEDTTSLFLRTIHRLRSLVMSIQMELIYASATDNCGRCYDHISDASKWRMSCARGSLSTYLYSDR